MSSKRDSRSASVELKQRLDRGDKLRIIDVREPNEWQINRIPVASSSRWARFPGDTPSSTPRKRSSCSARSGGRSAKAADFLRSVGFKRVLNLKGGILEWIDKVDPTQPKY